VCVHHNPSQNQVAFKAEVFHQVLQSAQKTQMVLVWPCRCRVIQKRTGKIVLLPDSIKEFRIIDNSVLCPVTNGDNVYFSRVDFIALYKALFCKVGSYDYSRRREARTPKVCLTYLQLPV